MSSPAITVEIGCPLEDAARLMRDEGIHRLVAVNDRGRAVGVLSSMDFALDAEAGSRPTGPRGALAVVPPSICL